MHRGLRVTLDWLQSSAARATLLRPYLLGAPACTGGEARVSREKKNKHKGEEGSSVRDVSERCVR